MTNSFDTELLIELSKNFTSDAWQLSDSFFHNLEKKFKIFNIPHETRGSILNGIIEYFQDFVDEYKGMSKINYLETLQLLKQIGSPSEILQAMDIPLVQDDPNDFGGSKIPDKIHCNECSWLNEADSNYCDNCGVKLLKQDEYASGKEVFPRIIASYPNVISIVFSSLILIFIGLIETTVLVLAVPDIMEDEYTTLLILVAILVMLLPGIIFGLIIGHMIESANKNQPSLFSSLRSPATAIIFSYMIFFCTGIVEAFFAFLLDAGDGPEWIVTDILPVVIFIMIIPAVTMGLFLAFLNNNLDSELLDYTVKQEKDLVENNFLLLELFENPYLFSTLISYLLLLIGNKLVYNLSISPFFSENVIDPTTYYFGIQNVVTAMITPAVILGIIFGYLLTRFRDEYHVKKKQSQIHVVKVQRKFSLGILLTLISLWLILIYIPATIPVSEIFTLSLFLILISFIGSFWIHKWNDSRQPDDIPHLKFLRRIKTVEKSIEGKIRKIMVIGGILILVMTYAIWGKAMPWTIFTLPAWIALAVSFMLLLNGVTILYYFSWTRINNDLKHKDVSEK